MAQGAGGGQPTKYQVKYNKQAHKLCLMGATDKELADFFEVCEATINNWKNAHPKFLDSIKQGRDIADANVSQSLYKRAIGYEFKEVTFERVDAKAVLEARGDDIVIDNAYRKKIVTKQQAADTTAAIFWLKNRQSKKWRDKQEVDHTTGGEKLAPSPLAGLTVQELLNIKYGKTDPDTSRDR